MVTDPRSARIVLVGGAARSGTTLLARLLAEHVPTYHFMGEANFLGPAAAAAESNSLREYLDKPEVRIRLAGLGVTYQKGTGPMQWLDLVDDLLRSSGAEPGSILIDHSPHSLAYRSAISRHCEIDSAFHIVRDGRAVWNSLLGTDFGPRRAVTAGYWWQASVANGLAQEIEGMAGRIKYEELVADPQVALDRAFRMLSNRPDHAASPTKVLVGAHGTLPTSASKTHSLVFESPVVARSEAWRNELGEKNVALFESVAGELLESLGYPRVSLLPPVGPTRRMIESQIDLILNGVSLAPRRLARLRRK